MADKKCDFCSNKVDNIVLHCRVCNIILCDICYNGTCGGNCTFVSSSGIHHFPYHGEMVLINPETKLNSPVVQNEFFLSCKTYISASFKERIKTILKFSLDKEKLISYAVEVKARKKKPQKKEASNIIISGNKIKCLKYIHSDEEEHLIEPKEIKSLLLDRKCSITYKSSSFGILIRELLESLDYPDQIIEEITTDILTLFTVFKFITFRCVPSLYNIKTSFEEGKEEEVAHLGNILILWFGSQKSDSEMDLEEETRIAKLKNMVAPYKSRVAIQHSGINYTISVTMQCVNL